MITEKLNFIPRVVSVSRAPRAAALSGKWSSMEVILKIAERCNINCTYCYFFNSTNQDYKDHPAYIRSDTIENVGKFLREAAISAGVTSLQIDFHGGEPLMMKKERFDQMCVSLHRALKDIPNVRLVVQTNAMLIDDDWIQIFAKHDVGVGVSIDGPKRYHDLYRLDHKGRGTYDQTIKGLRKVQEAIQSKVMKGSVGAIFVLNPEYEAREIFNHFVDDLGIHAMHFTFPMYSHDNVPKDINVALSKSLRGLFDAWVERADQRISIRYLNRFLGLLMGGGEYADMVSSLRNDAIAFTIASNGDVSGADDLRNTFPHLFWTGANVKDSRFSEFLDHPDIRGHLEAMTDRHPVCKACCWGKICNGGDLIGSEAFRYSAAEGFRNPNIYCDSIKSLLLAMTEFAIRRGVPFEHLSEVLIDSDVNSEASLEPSIL